MTSLVITAKATWVILGKIAVGSAFSNLGLGLLVFLKNWVPSEDDLRRRIDLLRASLCEQLNKQLHLLISSAVKDLDPEKLRSATAAGPDLIGDYTSRQVKLSHILFNLDGIERFVSLAHTLLIASLCGTVASVICVLAFESLKPLFAAIAIAIIIFQVALVFLVRRKLAQVTSYERSC